MKFRTGFVSNSSSSSFICGVARINDMAQLAAYLTFHNLKLDSSDLFITSPTDQEHSYDVRFGVNKVTVESFVATVSVPVKDETEKFLVVNICNNEGDYAFMEEDEDDEYGGDLNYDIDVEFFDPEQQQIYNMFFASESGLDQQVRDLTFGAERNG